MKTVIENDLKEAIRRGTYPNWMRARFEYSLFPTGKLFRPRLVHAIFGDLGEISERQKGLLASALEIHHTYSLIHDDLPCMDDDDFRRGRTSLHKRFSEWEAILVGDGLLNLSYHLLHQLSPQNPLFFRFASWCFGPKGLILGQAMDLAGLQGQKRTNELKTSRLFQACVVLPHLLNSSSIPLNKLKMLLKLGQTIGQAFQLNDDLDDSELSSTLEQTKLWRTSELDKLKALLSELRLEQTGSLISKHFG